MMKKIIAFLTAAVLVLSLAACSENVTDTQSTTDAENTTQSANETTEAYAEETTAEEATEEAAVEETTAEETTAEETTEAAKNATLTVEQVEDIAGEAGTVFNAATDEYAFYAVFRTDAKITDVKVLGLTFVDADEDGNITFDREVLYTVEEIRPDFNLSVHLTADGSIPAYGISYVDADGAEKAYSVNMSGEDGSLYLSAIN